LRCVVKFRRNFSSILLTSHQGYTRSRNEGTRHREARRPSSRRNDNLQGPRAVLVDGDTSKETFARWSGPRGSCAESVNLANALRDRANCTRIAYAYGADFFSRSSACNLLRNPYSIEYTVNPEKSKSVEWDNIAKKNINFNP